MKTPYQQLNDVFPNFSVTQETDKLISIENGCWLVTVLLDGTAAMIRVCSKGSNLEQMVAATSVPLAKVGAVAQYLVSTATIMYL